MAFPPHFLAPPTQRVVICSCCCSPGWLPRALCSACDSSKRATKAKLCSVSLAQGQRCLSVSPLSTPGGCTGRIYCLQWRSSPALTHPPLTASRGNHEVQLRYFAWQEEFRDESLTCKEGENLLMTLQHQSSGVSHQPSEKQQGCTCTRHSQGTDAEPGFCSPFSCL